MGLSISAYWELDAIVEGRPPGIGPELRAGGRTSASSGPRGGAAKNVGLGAGGKHGSAELVGAVEPRGQFWQ